MEHAASRPRPANKVNIQDALPEHAAAIRALSDETHRIHRARLPHVFGPENGYQHWLIERAFSEGPPAKSQFRSRLRVASDGQALSGYVLLIWDQPEHKNDAVSAVIADIAVTPDAQRQGIADALLKDAAQLRDVMGWHSLCADVWDGNTASHALFAQGGFTAERTVYRLGTPPPLTETILPSAPKATPHFWWIAIAFLIAIAFVASVP